MKTMQLQIAVINGWHLLFMSLFKGCRRKKSEKEVFISLITVKITYTLTQRNILDVTIL